MSMVYKRLWVSCVAFLFAGISLASPSFADDYEVMRSSAPKYSEGQTLAKGATINVPEGKSIRLLAAASGNTHTIMGPFTGTIAEYLDPACPPWKRKAKVCKGGDKTIGGTKGKSSGEKSGE